MCKKVSWSITAADSGQQTRHNRQQTRDIRKEKRDMRHEIKDKRQETRDKRQLDYRQRKETRDNGKKRQETLD
jgi:hypothetical protein